MTTPNEPPKNPALPTEVDIVLLLDSLNRKAAYANVVLTILTVLFALLMGYLGFTTFHATSVD